MSDENKLIFCISLLIFAKNIAFINLASNNYSNLDIICINIILHLKLIVNILLFNQKENYLGIKIL